MGLGSTAKKIQALSEHAEAIYKQVQDLQQRIVSLEEETNETSDTVRQLDHQLTEQRELLLAIADAQGIDTDEVLADAAIDEAELEADGGETDSADKERGGQA